MPKLKSRHWPGPAAGAFGAVSVFDTGDRPVVRERTSNTYTLEEDRRRQWQIDREALAEWREREANPDEYEAEQDFCLDCGTETWLDITGSGTLTERCPQCGWVDRGEEYASRRTVRGAFGEQTAFRCRRRSFEPVVLTTARWEKHKPGIAVEYVPRVLPRNHLVADALRTLANVTKRTNVPAGQDASNWWAGVRWPSGMYCPRCSSSAVYSMAVTNRRALWRCRSCVRQFSLLSGTPFEGAHLTVEQIVLALWMVAHERNQISYTRLANGIGANDKTGFTVLRCIRESLGAAT